MGQFFIGPQTKCCVRRKVQSTVCWTVCQCLFYLPSSQCVYSGWRHHPLSQYISCGESHNCCCVDTLIILGFLFLSDFSFLKHLPKFNHMTFYGNLTADSLQWRKKIAILSMTVPPVGNPSILSLERLSQVNQPDTHRSRISILFGGKFGS